jgi:hypothetical protein
MGYVLVVIGVHRAAPEFAVRSLAAALGTRTRAQRRRVALDHVAATSADQFGFPPASDGVGAAKSTFAG